MPSDPDPFQGFEQLVQGLVKLPPGSDGSVSSKIDLLERLIEQWRIDRHTLHNDVDFEEFLVWRWIEADGRLQFLKTPAPVDRSAGTRPVRLQRKLLVFLLLHHGRHKHVLESIRAFIGKIRPDLDVRDFKKTETGVVRCFTNTRFAANKLRDYGLLRFTHQEAFKIWVLSLPGFLVAAKALATPNWRLPDFGDPFHGLDPFILECAHGLKDYPTMVATLANICTPDTKVFDSFDGVLKIAYQLLKQYWEALRDTNLKTEERQKLSTDLIDQLDNILGYSQFLEELTSCIQIEHLLAKADAAANKL